MSKRKLAVMLFALCSCGPFASAVFAGEPESLSIKDLISRVQQELIDSQMERKKAGRESLFEVKNLTIEINFVVTTTTNKQGELDLKLVTVGAGKQYENQQVQKIILELSAIPGRAGTLPMKRPQR